jgi:hypothetical protein
MHDRLVKDPLIAWNCIRLVSYNVPLKQKLSVPLTSLTGPTQIRLQIRASVRREGLADEGHYLCEI